MMERGWVGTWDGGVILIIIMGEKKKKGRESCSFLGCLRKLFVSFPF